MSTAWASEQLQDLERRGLRRQLLTLSSAQSTRVVIDGREVINFSSNDYLGLANDARIINAAQAAMSQYGFGAGASRLVCGNMSAHETLETSIASLKKTESCLIFNNGYAANTGIIPAFLGREDIIFSDRLNHASILDGILLSRAELKRYQHMDMQALEEGLRQSGRFRRRLIVTDSVFSMDGDVAPLEEIVRLAKEYDAMVMIDEAHGFGVLGQDGGGLAEELGLGSNIDIQMGTLSKSAGCFGAYTATSRMLRDYLINHARSFIYSTALPPSAAAAAKCAVDLIRDKAVGGRLRQAVKKNAEHLRAGLKMLGFDTMKSSTLIIPILIGDPVKAVDMSKKLFNQGFFVQAIRPPTVPVHSARLRVTVTAKHTQDDLNQLLSAMKDL